MQEYITMNQPSKAYGIASTSTVCCGHGDYVERTSISSLNPYGGAMPPVFEDRGDAEDWIENQETFNRYKVVELEYRSYDG
jgi:hypothetical protein